MFYLDYFLFVNFSFFFYYNFWPAEHLFSFLQKLIFFVSHTHFFLHFFFDILFFILGLSSPHVLIFLFFSFFTISLAKFFAVYFSFLISINYLHLFAINFIIVLFMLCFFFCYKVLKLFL